MNDKTINKLAKNLIDSKKQIEIIFNAIEEQLKLIYEAEPLLKELYKLNLDKQTIWDGIFNDVKIKDIPKFTNEEIILRVHKFAREKKELWLQLSNPEIEPLTTDKLIEYDFGTDNIERLKNWDNYETPCFNSKGYYWASNIEHKIYSGKEAVKKVCFKDLNHPSFPVNSLDLVPEYYNLILSKYIKEQRELAGIIFDLQATKERFRQSEISKIKNSIEAMESEPVKLQFRKRSIESFIHYLNWLEKIVNYPTDEEVKAFVSLKSWQYPNWNRWHYFENSEDYRINFESNPHNEFIGEKPHYEIKFNDNIQARLTPDEFFRTFYELGNEKAEKESDLEKRILILKKVLSDLKIYTKTDLNKLSDRLKVDYRELFSLNEIEEEIKNSIENIELSVKLKSNNQNSIQLTSKQNLVQSSTVNELIKHDLLNRLSELESKIQDKITDWKQRNDLIGCAAFCQLLFDKKYYTKGSTIRKSVNSFALTRYGTDIETQLKSSFNKEREKHKTLLAWVFK